MINSNSIEWKNEIDVFVNYYLNRTMHLRRLTQGTTLSNIFWNSLKEEHNIEIQKIFTEKLFKKSLIDLGVGHYINIPFYIDYLFSKWTGIDIDLSNSNGHLIVLEKMKENGINASYLEGTDILSYLSKNVSDTSSNFFMGAINGDVIVDEKYWEYLCIELYRCTERYGIIIDAGVGSIGYFLEKFIPNKFKLIYSQNHYEGINIFEKT